ncbi:MAG: hypothetical protein K2W94_06085 [Alphaproteobacteria bacterium]|nr:hypothetical protein [Alphaproteobacteria bacterium]
MKKIYYFITLALLFINNLPTHATDDLIVPPAAKKRFFTVAPKNQKEAEEFIFPILKPTNEVKKAAEDFFSFAFTPENAPFTAFLTLGVWNNLIDHTFGKGEDDQLTALNALHMRTNHYLNRKRRAETPPLD